MAIARLPRFTVGMTSEEFVADVSADAGLPS